MPIKSIEQLKEWFSRGLYPTESNFADLIDSFFHRAEKIPLNAVETLEDKLEKKTDKTLLGVSNGIATLNDKGKLTATQLPFMDTFIPIDITFERVGDSPVRHLALRGDIPQGYVPVVFRKIRRTTRNCHLPAGKQSKSSSKQWYHNGTAVLLPYKKNVRDVHLLAFPLYIKKKQKSPYLDHNLPPTAENQPAQAHDFVLVHNVDTNKTGGGTKGYPAKFDLRVAWGSNGRKPIFKNKGIGEKEWKMSKLSFEFGIGLVKEEALYGRAERITLADLSSNLATFKVVSNISLTEDSDYKHTCKPAFSFSK